MTSDDFDTFTAALCQGGDEHTQGYYPTMPWNDRMAALWFRHLQPFPAAKVFRALELYVMLHPDHAPTLETFVEHVKALIPPPATRWYQFAPAQVEAMQQDGYGGVLRSLLPTPDSTAWAKCWIWLFEQGLTRPGKEAECARECRRLAERYPRDHDDWVREAWKLEEQSARRPS
jgi:hypothetical protein